MRKTACAAAALTLTLAACNSGRDSSFVANAPQEPAPAPMKLSQRDALNESIARHARVHGIPESLVHAAVRRESNYNPSLKHGPYWGLMQIRYDTACSVGYAGPAKGLLDAETNLTYAVAYLANAFRVAGGDERRAIRLYARGYYYDAKRRGLLGEMRKADASPVYEKAAARTIVAAER
jgi:soluble lytic murein transglycosylase-like protein